MIPVSKVFYSSLVVSVWLLLPISARLCSVQGKCRKKLDAMDCILIIGQFRQINTPHIILCKFWFQKASRVKAVAAIVVTIPPPSFFFCLLSLTLSLMACNLNGLYDCYDLK